MYTFFIAFTNIFDCAIIYLGETMITKLPSNNQEAKYELKVTDKNNKSFTMTVGGNFDLY